MRSLVKWASLALTVAVLAGLGALAADRFVRGPSFDLTRLERPPPPIAAPRERVHAFYSGHSLTDGVPEAVAAIARDLGVSFSFDHQSLEGSLLQKRLLPEQLAGRGLPKSGYDALVVTERHDLLYTLLHEDTLPSLVQMQERVRAESPALETYLYHVWLEIDFADPAHFVAYERAALPIWECAASALERRAPGRRVHLLPGGSALGELVEKAVRGDVPGLAGASNRERLERLFADRVHLTALGKYFMASVHFAALFGRSPEGAGAPSGAANELGRALSSLAWEHVSRYRNEGAGRPDPAACSDYARRVACPLFAAHPREEGAAPGWLRRWRDTFACSRAFADPHRDPFAAVPGTNSHRASPAH